MPTLATTDAFIASGVEVTALEQRLFDAALFSGDGSPGGVRGGIVYHGPGSLAVTVDGTDKASIGAGSVVIPGATGQGVYRGTIASTTAVAPITARNSTNPRIDLVTASVSGGSVVFGTIDGTPAGSPPVPTLTAGHYEIARLSVPKVGGGPVTIDTSWRTYAASAGGELLTPTVARLPATGAYKGQRCIALDTGITHRWSGTAWVSDLIRADVSTSGNIVFGTGTRAIVTFDVEAEDVGGPTGGTGLYNPATGMFTCPVTGLYRLEATISFQYASGGRRGIQFRRNGATTIVPTIVETAAAPDDATYLTVSREVRCAAGDTLSVWALQTSGVAMWVLPGSSMAIRKVAP